MKNIIAFILTLSLLAISCGSSAAEPTEAVDARTSEVVEEASESTSATDAAQTPLSTDANTRTPSNTAEAPSTSISTLTAAPSTAPVPVSEVAQVTRVIDGDKIEVNIGGQSYRVRYIGMDTPERGRPFFSEAPQANEQLVSGQTIILVKDVSETDRYGRLLRYVYLERVWWGFLRGQRPRSD